MTETHRVRIRRPLRISAPGRLATLGAIGTGLIAAGSPAVTTMAAAKPTGNRHGIALERKAIKAITRVRGFRFIRTGHMYSDSTIALANGYHFFDGPLDGTYPMRESGTIVLNRDKLVWEDDRMTPICLPGTQPVTQGGETYTETDHLSARTHLLKSEHVTASAIRALQAFSFDERIVRYVRKAPRAPRLTPCD